MNTPRRIIAIALAGAVTLVACGDDEPVADPASEPAPEPADEANDDPADEPVDSPVAVGDGPDATIAPDLPDDFLPGVGPVEVVGDVLPILETNDVAADPVVGSAAPVLIGEDFDGDAVRIDAVASGPTMVVFLAHWCPHCNDEIPVINGLHDDGRLPAGLNVVGVSTAANPGRPNFPPGAWLDDKDWAFPAMADGIDTVRETYIASEAFGVSGFPFTALVDENGDVAARWSGGRPADEIVRLVETHLGLG